VFDGVFNALAHAAMERELKEGGRTCTTAKSSMSRAGSTSG
jgi:hypothetical protein